MRSEETERHAALLKYLGDTNSHLFTDKDLREIEDGELGFHDWLRAQMRLDTVEKENAFEAKLTRWYEGDRFILYPELFIKQRPSFIEHNLPEILAKYVRGQFTGSSEKITKQKISDVTAIMLKENPDWWINSERKKIFLNRFAEIHPGCCDGRKKVTTKSQPPPLRKDINHKNKKGCVIFILPIIAVYFLFKIFA